MPEPSADSVRIAIVMAEFNIEITRRMLEQAMARARELGAEVTHVFKVPGSFDMPLAIRRLIERGDVDAVATIGAIVKGETQHDVVIAHQLANKISDISLQYGKPVSLGVSGPGMSWDQGVERAADYATRSIEAAVKMTRRLRKLTNGFAASYPVEVS